MKKIAAVCVCLMLALSACSAPKDNNSSAVLVSSEKETSSGYVKPDGVKTVSLPSADSENWALFLVNNYNKLPENYEPEVVDIGSGKLFHAKAAKYLRKMMRDAQKAGVQLFLSSSYRSVEYQKNLFNNNIAKLMRQGMSEKQALKETAYNIQKPGMSEHNTALAADIVSADWFSDHDDLTQEFENTEHFKWLSENAYKYGFILRYPKDKQEITEINYEPWHYRYVGKKAAEEIKKRGICLEEYMS